MKKIVSYNPICNKLFNYPKYLSCHHSCSVECLEKIYTSLSKPSKIVNNDGKMGKPRGIGCSRNGKWAVADETNHSVYLYDGEDQLVRKIGGEGFSNGQLYSPNDEDHLYITDTNRVQKFTIDGDYVSPVWIL